MSNNYSTETMVRRSGLRYESMKELQEIACKVLGMDMSEAMHITEKGLVAMILEEN